MTNKSNLKSDGIGWNKKHIRKPYKRNNRNGEIHLISGLPFPPDYPLGIRGAA